MHAYAVYQLPDTNPMIRDMHFMSPLEIEAISDQYEVVARVDARTKDEVYRIGNFVCEEDSSLIEVVGEMRSVSVGDIIHNLTSGDTHVVDKIGFVKIDMKETV